VLPEDVDMVFTLNASKTKLISDEIPINQGQVDANNKAGLKPKNVIIHCSGGPSLKSAVNVYLANANSIHLLIERNGLEIAQMVDFNRIAAHANEYDVSSLGIELIYPGYLLEKPGTYRSRDRYDPLEMIFARAENDHKKRWWPLYPQEQLDTLLEITRLLNQTFGLERILTHDEINQLQLDNGPAFPINRLRQLIRSDGNIVDAPEETAEEAAIFLQPGGVGFKAIDQPLPAHTPISITDEDGEWVLVEVLSTLAERRWLAGWIEAKKVAVKPITPLISDDHLLLTGENRQVKYLAPYEKNFNPKIELEPRYIIIHFTTGTSIQSTIHWFQNPTSGVSAHLLVGRNGRVIQFVPFNKLAFHSGTSTWEGVTNLNRFAIGIEVDNAGYLRTTVKGFMRKNVVIPEEQVRSKKHWKEPFNRPWQTFPDDQILVVQKIVQALKEKYPTIQEILGHDMVNLKNRLDPGPYYPLGELREAILGDPQPAMQRYQTVVECPLYENVDNSPPNPAHPVLGELPISTVRVRQVHDVWSLVIVKTSPNGQLVNKEGWVLSNSIKPLDDKARTKFTQPFYQFIPASIVRLPALESKASPLPEGAQVRIQFEDGDWALVAPILEIQKDADGRYEMLIPDEKVKKKYLEGWVERQVLVDV
jgi:N-acetylmuramoyl-L-alanine amidase